MKLETPSSPSSAIKEDEGTSLPLLRPQPTSPSLLIISALPLSLPFSLSFPHASHHPSHLNPKSIFSPSRGAGAVSADASGFPYTLQGGLRSAIRVARVVKEAVDRNESDVRWFVFGNDDTVFFVDNVVRTLSKYDHNRWFHVGSNSESYD